MVFKVPSSFSNGENASYGLGTTSTGAAGSGACSASKINNPGGVAYDPNPGHNTLFVGEYGNERVTVFKVAPAYIATGENASYVIGQPNLTTCGSGTAQNAVWLANYLMYDPGTSRLFVDDASTNDNGTLIGNNRVMIFDGGSLPQGDYFNP